MEKIRQLEKELKKTITLADMQEVLKVYRLTHIDFIYQDTHIGGMLTDFEEASRQHVSEVIGLLNEGVIKKDLSFFNEMLVRSEAFENKWHKGKS